MTNNLAVSRVPAGTPTGGRFAPKAAAESTLTLGPAPQPGYAITRLTPSGNGVEVSAQQANLFPASFAVTAHAFPRVACTRLAA